VIRIGTSGWHYPSGRGTWNGVFYPPRRTSGRAAVDELAFYAEHFDTVEVNSTFYRVPPPDMTRSWAARTPRGFEFAVKLHQKFTHPAMYAEASGDAAPEVSADDVETFARTIEPLAAAGKLGPLLAQFPPAFTSTTATRDYLSWLLDRFRDIPMAVELRHRSWSDRQDQTLSLLASHQAAFVQIDEPKFASSIRQQLRIDAAPFSYLRLHGRNAAQWWSHDATEDRYNYLYSGEELEPFAQVAEEARRLVKKLYLYMNNHFEAKGVANAAMLRHRLGLDVAGTYPESFTRHFPGLRGIVATEERPRTRTLF
jgi:uncharacterized protein YecE (DUF72 family)